MSTLTPTQYQAYANRSNQPDLLDAASDTALAEMRARIEELEQALHYCLCFLDAKVPLEAKRIENIQRWWDVLGKKSSLELAQEDISRACSF